MGLMYGKFALAFRLITGSSSLYQAKLPLWGNFKNEVRLASLAFKPESQACGVGVSIGSITSPWPQPKYNSVVGKKP